MPRPIAQALLVLLLFPLAFMLYLSMYVAGEDYFEYDELKQSLTAGVVTWAFVALYWMRMWRPSLVWDARRKRGALIGVAIGLAAGLVIGTIAWTGDDDVGAFVGSATPPLAWLVTTVVFWRETDAERAARLGKIAADSIVCPKCGYSLTGLSEARCPECGARFTLGEMLAAQPGRSFDARG